MRFQYLVALTSVGCLSAVQLLTAQSSRCADCHLSNPNTPGQAHVSDWDRSPHGRNNVGCERCHGGDPTTVEVFRAHREIIGPPNAKSPLHARNIPTTCGACHVGPFVAFQDSRHYELLESGDLRGPTCVTCHGDTDGRVLSARALESRCNSCHGPGEQEPRAGRARTVRELYQGLATVREHFKQASSLVRRVDDAARRTQLTNALQQAEVPLIRAVNAGHQFVYDDLQSYLAQAESRVQALLAQLTNPPR